MAAKLFVDILKSACRRQSVQQISVFGHVEFPTHHTGVRSSGILDISEEPGTAAVTMAQVRLASRPRDQPADSGDGWSWGTRPQEDVALCACRKR